VEKRTLSEAAQQAGVLRDAIVRLGMGSKPAARPHHTVRLVVVAVQPHAKRGGRKGKTAGPASNGQLLMATNLLDGPVEIMALIYQHRWAIEFFVKELKSTLGLHQDRFRRFRNVEAWVQACLVAFVSLEWYRARPLRPRARSDEQRRGWPGPQTYGWGTAVRQAAAERDLAHLFRWSGTTTGREKRRQCLRAALPLECRETRQNQKDPAAGPTKAQLQNWRFRLVSKVSAAANTPRK